MTLQINKQFVTIAQSSNYYSGIHCKKNCMTVMYVYQNEIGFACCMTCINNYNAYQKHEMFSYDDVIFFFCNMFYVLFKIKIYSAFSATFYSCNLSTSHLYMHNT